DQAGVPIFIDQRAFQAAIGTADIGKAPVKLPRLLGVRLATVLRLLLREISAAGGGEAPGWQAVYLVRSDYVEITTQAAAQEEITSERRNVGSMTSDLEDQESDRPRRWLPLVAAEFDRRPLTDALKELADATSFSIVV